MTKTGWLIAGLFFLLLGTNVWWIYATVNQAVSLTYSRDSLQMNKTAVAQLLAVVEESREADASRQSIVEAALSPFADHDHRPQPFEKEGYLWVGRVGLAFSERGELQNATRTWSPP